jgi:hypothetical protein
MNDIMLTADEMVSPTHRYDEAKVKKISIELAS